jgi:hypothetical protein
MSYNPSSGRESFEACWLIETKACQQAQQTKTKVNQQQQQKKTFKKLSFLFLF